MSTLQCRGLIAGATAVLALLFCNSVSAQGLISPGPYSVPRREGPVYDLTTGVTYDVVNQAKAERRVQVVQERLVRNSESGNKAAADRDVRRIANLKYRIAVDCWLIRKNRLQDPGYYPVRTDQVSVCAINQAASPPQFYTPPQFDSTQPLIPNPDARPNPTSNSAPDSPRNPTPNPDPNTTPNTTPGLNTTPTPNSNPTPNP